MLGMEFGSTSDHRDWGDTYGGGWGKMVKGQASVSERKNARGIQV